MRHSYDPINEEDSEETPPQQSAQSKFHLIAIIIILSFVIMTLVCCSLSLNAQKPSNRMENDHRSNLHFEKHQNKTDQINANTTNQKPSDELKTDHRSKSRLETHQNKTDLSTANNTTNLIPIPKRQLIANDIGAWSWDNCDGTFSKNRTQDLYDQLTIILDVFERHDVKHVVWYGTLIGAMRDNGMNPYEVDNDIMLLDTRRSFPFEIYEELFARGIILFFDNHNLWRACKYAQVAVDKGAPWGNHYFPYTDIYPLHWLQNDMNSLGLSWNHKIKKKNFADMSVYVPEDDEFTEQWLLSLYSNWRSPPENAGTKYGQN